MSAKHVFPWWAGYWLLNPWRQKILNPLELLEPYVLPGMTILDAGCAMGFFSIPLAEMTGPTGRVFCVDPQKKMLAVLERCAAGKNLSDIIVIRPCTFSSLRIDDLAEQIDLALVFGVFHEVRDQQAFIHDIALALKPGGVLIFGEPHVISQNEFHAELAALGKTVFKVVKKMSKGHNQIAILYKNSQGESQVSCQRATQAGLPIT